jgi:hypothetical protein
MSSDVESVIQAIEQLPNDISAGDKARLFKEVQKKLGLSMNTQVLGGTQILGSTIQINICDRSSFKDLAETLVEVFGKDAAMDLIKAILQKF